jgi:hypothetical protein
MTDPGAVDQHLKKERNMDWKIVVIGALALSAILLGSIVASGLRPENTAYGQGGVYATYLVVGASVQDNYAEYAVLDTESRKMLFYKVDATKLVLEPVKGIDFAKDFAKAP